MYSANYNLYEIWHNGAPVAQVSASDKQKAIAKYRANKGACDDIIAKKIISRFNEQVCKIYK